MSHRFRWMALFTFALIPLEASILAQETSPRAVILPVAQAALRIKQIVAHRGASAERPENTLASTLRAIESNATAIEVDVRTTRDGQLVLLHDARLDRTTNGQGLVGELKLDEIKQLDAGKHFGEEFAGERVPTLIEVLEVCHGKIDVLLDLKESGEAFDEHVAETIRKHGDPAGTIVGARSVEQAKAFRKLLPNSRQLGLIASPDDIEAFAAAGVETIRIWPKWLEKDATLPDRVRRAGAKLHLNGTLGTSEEVLPLLAYRPDSLSSDDPARLVATLKQLRQTSDKQP